MLPRNEKNEGNAHLSISMPSFDRARRRFLERHYTARNENSAPGVDREDILVQAGARTNEMDALSSALDSLAVLTRSAEHSTCSDSVCIPDRSPRQELQQRRLLRGRGRGSSREYREVTSRGASGLDARGSSNDWNWFRELARRVAVLGFDDAQAVSVALRRAVIDHAVAVNDKFSSEGQEHQLRLRGVQRACEREGGNAGIVDQSSAEGSLITAVPAAVVDEADLDFFMRFFSYLSLTNGGSGSAGIGDRPPLERSRVPRTVVTRVSGSPFCWPFREMVRGPCV